MDDRALVAVYPDKPTAQAVADHVRGRRFAGVQVRVDDPHDRVTEVEAEVAEEVENALIAPQASFVFTKEMIKSMAVLVPLGAVVGALLALPFAFFAFEDTSLAVGLLWAAIVGAVMGGLIATIVGAALGARGPADQGAAIKGVPVRLAGDLGDDVVRIVASHHPLRVDLVSEEGTPIETLLTEDETTPDGILQRLRHQFTQNVHGEWDSTQADKLRRLQAVKRDMEQALNEPEPPTSG